MLVCKILPSQKTIQLPFFKYFSEMKTKINRIKEVLKDQNKTQTWLSKELGKSFNMVNGYVQNRRQPRLEVLLDISKILDVDIKDLIVSTKTDV